MAQGSLFSTITSTGRLRDHEPYPSHGSGSPGGVYRARRGRLEVTLRSYPFPGTGRVGKGLMVVSSLDQHWLDTNPMLGTVESELVVLNTPMLGVCNEWWKLIVRLDHSKNLGGRRHVETKAE